MPTRVEHDRQHDRLHLVFQDDRFIAEGAWIAGNAEIALAADRSPIEVCIYGYYTEPKSWPFTEENVKLWGLQPWLEDLRLIWQNFFAPKGFAVQSIKYEGPDGEEIIFSPGSESQ